jgi:hypothetical protein
MSWKNDNFEDPKRFKITDSNISLMWKFMYFNHSNILIFEI